MTVRGLPEDQSNRSDGDMDLNVKMLEAVKHLVGAG
jgi:hypothetical protein